MRNEDIFITAAVSSVLKFCDKLIVLDHESQDHTWEVLTDLAGRHKHVQLHKISSPEQSHSFIEPLAGSRTWVFGVDGDEIYDPVGLETIKEEIYSGQYNQWWQLFGNVLNCTEINYDQMLASGYLAPPCRSITKLFNFDAIDRWGGECPERLHGGTIQYRRGFDERKRLNIHKETNWEKSHLRCLHTCFLPRSTTDKESSNVRLNIVEKNRIRTKSVLGKLLHSITSRSGQSKLKFEKYMRGDLVEKDIRMFHALQYSP